MSFLKPTNVPKVSLYIPTYNYGLYLEKAVDSVLKQNYNDWELIIIDGGSTDDTLQIYQGLSLSGTERL